LIIVTIKALIPVIQKRMHHLGSIKEGNKMHQQKEEIMSYMFELQRINALKVTTIN